MRIDWTLIAPPIRYIVRHYLAASRGLLLIVALIVLVSAVVNITAPYVFSRLIDTLGATDMLAGVVWGFLAYSLLVGAGAAMQRMVQFLGFMTSESLGFISSTSFFERLVTKTSTFFLDHNPAEIESARERGRAALNVLVQLALVAIIPGVVQITLALVLLGAVISIEIMAIVVVYGLGFIVVTYFANKRTRKHLDAAIAASQDSARFVGNAIGAMDTLRQFGSHDWMIGRFTGKAGEVLRQWRNFCLAHVRFASVFGVALIAQFSLTFWLLLPRVEAGQLSVGDVVLFNALLLQLNQPFEMIGMSIDELIRSYSRFLPFARMWAAAEEDDPRERAPLAITNGRIALTDVSFRYDNGRGLDPVSFTAERGRLTFLVGETGSGKSTLFKLLLKSVAPQTGNIVIDAIRLASVGRRDWFARVASVPQDVVLLNDTLATNIVLGRPHDEERLRLACAKAAILEFIEALPEKFETIVGERGLKLSGGERQRLAIARALYADPDVLLLDEASSALDEVTEKDIMDHLRAVSDRVTVIAITHRLSVIGEDDKVVSLQADAAGGFRGGRFP